MDGDFKGILEVKEASGSKLRDRSRCFKGVVAVRLCEEDFEESLVGSRGITKLRACLTGELNPKVDILEVRSDTLVSIDESGSIARIVNRD